MPLTVQMQRLYGLTAYLPAVLPPDSVSDLPDEIALVFYKTQDAYDNAKKFPGGQAYSDLHSVVFDLEKSGSGFPDFLGQSFSLGKPYHLLQNPADWKKGIAHVYVGTRKRGLTVDSYSSQLGLEVQNVQKNPGLVDGAVLFASEDWMLFWQHSTSAKVPIPNFSNITDLVLDRDAECKEIPVHFTSPLKDLSATPGSFFNFQFSTVY
jgi:hypothetical protein